MSRKDLSNRIPMILCELDDGNSPEKNLLFAIFLRALADALCVRSELDRKSESSPHRADAVSWLLNDRNIDPFSVRWVLTHLSEYADGYYIKIRNLIRTECAELSAEDFKQLKIRLRQPRTRGVRSKKDP